MSAYEAPTLTEVGSVREMTLGGLNLFAEWDEIRKWKDGGPFGPPGNFS